MRNKLALNNRISGIKPGFSATFVCLGHFYVRFQ